MKKIIFLFSILTILFINGYGQEQSPQDKTLGYDLTWFTYTAPTTTYATTATDSNWYYTVLNESKGPVKYNFKITLDSISGTKQVTPVVLKAKIWPSDSWTAIDTITWSTGVDTTILFTQTTTAQYYRYWRVDITTALKAFIIQVDELSAKFWE
jgi:hypothetical protein